MAKITHQPHNKKHVAHLEQVHRQERAILIGTIVICVLVIGIVAYGILSATVFMPYRSVASVNGDRITAGEFQSQVKLRRVQLINQYMQYMQYAQMFGIQDPVNDQNFGPMLNPIVTELDANSTAVIGQKVIDLAH